MELIDRAAVVAEMERLYKEHSSRECIDEAGVVLDKLEDFIDTLEVKEVNLDTVMEEEYDKYRCYNSNGSMLVTLNKLQFNSIAKHFFELGIKAAQKGE